MNEKRERFIAYITKYALTRGIMEVEVELCLDIDPGGGMISTLNESGMHESFHGRDWHRTLAGAQARYLKLIAAKRKSLTRAIEKLARLEAQIRKDSSDDHEATHDRHDGDPARYPNQDTLEAIGRPIRGEG